MRTILSLLFLTSILCLRGADNFVDFTGENGNMMLVHDGKSVDMVCDSADYEGVRMAVGNLLRDFEDVTGIRPAINRYPHGNCIIVGSIGSEHITRLISNGKIPRDSLEGKREKYLLGWIANPMEGVDTALVIAGSDLRGTVYGIYELSRQIGVSPWYWWADVPVSHHDRIFVKPGVYTDGEPKVEYRGIFINDEWPSFGKWATQKFSGLNSDCYKHIFELLLRLKGNFMWPAMWNSAFYDDDAANGTLANAMGIVMGTSHHEPMALAQQDWKRRGHGPWSYTANGPVLREFWRDGIRRACDWEKIVTVGMRGDGDEAMDESGNIELMERIISDQRDIITEVTGKDSRETPQVWALYKEVQDYYDNGMKVPDDIILLLCDDNWGNVRKLPSLSGPRHPGGYGMYYHVDYVGAPRNSKWINISPVPRIWEQMNLSYRYGVDKIWILNVGDIKPMEYPITFFLDMAWNPDKFTADNIASHSVEFCREIFGSTHAAEAARILRKYAQLNRRVTPELLDKDTYSLDNYDEWTTVVADYDRLALDAEALADSLPESLHDTWFQIIGYPVKACANLYDMYFAQAMNHGMARIEHPTANLWAKRVKECFELDSVITSQYHNIVDGKWNHMMDEQYIGYTSWNSPPRKIMPEVIYVDINDTVDINLPSPAAIVYNYADCPRFFHGDNGYVSIEAEHYTRKMDGFKAQWSVISDMGRTLSGITPQPVTAPVDDMCLEYDIVIPDSATAVVTMRFSPTLNFNGLGLSYAVSFDDGGEQVVNINGDFDGVTGNIWHREHVIDSKTIHTLSGGRHTLRYRPMDNALILQKIIIDLGALKDSFLGPPETLIK